jgi:signal transduction histidine kinase
MDWQFHPYAVPLFVGAAVMLGIAATAIRRRSAPGAGVLVMFSLSLIFYMVGYAFELGSSKLSDILFWMKIEYLGIAPGPALVFILILTYTNNRRFLTFFACMMLFTIPAITLILAWTNSYHEWIWQDPQLENWGRYYVIKFTHGKWYPINALFFITMLGMSMALIARAYFRMAGLYRRQTSLILLSTIIPFIAFIVYVLDVLKTPLDLNPYILSVTAILIAWGMFDFQFLDIMPVAREAVLASMPDSVIVINDQHLLVDLNPAAQRLFGIKLRESIGHPAADILARWPPIVSEIEDHSRRTRRELALHIQERDYFFDLYFSTLQNHAGHLIVLRDVTARALAEKRLKETNEHLAYLRRVDAELNRKLSVKYVMEIALEVALQTSLADAAFIGLIEGSEGLRIKHCAGQCQEGVENALIPLNEGALARLIQRYEPQIILNQPSSFMVMPDIQAQILVPLLSGKTLIGIMGLETRYPEHFSPAIFESITLLAARVAVAIDNSTMYEEREKLVKELDAFARTVAHDLKSPLAVIYGYSLLLKEDYDHLPFDQVKESVDILFQTSEKMANIVDELLMLASVRRMEDVPIAPLKMAEVVAGARSRLLSQIHDSRATITAPEQWPTAAGYGPWVEEVWANYISNAIKYGGTPPVIELGADVQPDGMIRFWVRDNGQGITPDKQSKLFTEFSRLHNVRVEGYGLGLSIVQRIIARLGGQVSVESEAGTGSTFSFTLPAA